MKKLTIRGIMIVAMFLSDHAISQNMEDLIKGARPMPVTLLKVIQVP